MCFKMLYMKTQKMELSTCVVRGGPWNPEVIWPFFDRRTGFNLMLTQVTTIERWGGLFKTLKGWSSWRPRFHKGPPTGEIAQDQATKI